MQILNFDYDLEHGFVWIEVNTNTNKDRWTVQCCVEDKKKKIIMHDCGADWGCCGDANEKAFNHWGENRCLTALFRKAKESGFEVI